jgi:hypothetical protein
MAVCVDSQELVRRNPENRRNAFLATNRGVSGDSDWHCSVDSISTPFCRKRGFEPRSCEFETDLDRFCASLRPFAETTTPIDLYQPVEKGDCPNIVRLKSCCSRAAACLRNLSASGTQFAHRSNRS